ncbi:MAG: GYDIA family GHMP kinase [Schleiferiaceae bacterium]|jgi:mevalonate kinase|nr:GYDIA family GHMP kinase [Schleiferiaceae bacterium]
MEQRFYGRGKLLLTSEYLVVDGAKALALPCKYGQDLIVHSSPSEVASIEWTSKDEKGEIWFEGKFRTLKAPTRSGGERIIVEPLTSTDDDVALRLSMLLFQAILLKGGIDSREFRIETNLEFARDWGLGSSSTLIYNVASWLEIDPFTLFFKYTKGSGYDVACAGSDQALLYQRNTNQPVIEKVEWAPDFQDELFFVHLGNKQHSDQEVTKYSLLSFDRQEAISEINDITNRILNSDSLKEFESLVNLHEDFMSGILKRPTIKSLMFSDYQGSIKSLGAWGGDFVLVTRTSQMHEYFSSKGHLTILSFSDMIYGG